MIEGTPFTGEVVVRRRRWASAETGFAVLDAESDGDAIVLVGPLAHLEERERVRVTGVWQDDRRFGLQVRVATAEPLAPAGETALSRTSARPPRRRRARRAAARAPRRGRARGDRPRSATPPSRPLGLTRGGACARRSRRGTGCARRARCTSCSPRTASPGSCRASPQHYGERAHVIVRERPYELTSVFGVGFQTADRIARAGDAPLDSPARTRAGVLHVLAEAEKDGSTCLPGWRSSRAGGRSARRAGAGRRAPARDARRRRVWPSRSTATAAVWAYRPPTAALEAELAGAGAASWCARGRACAAPEPRRRAARAGAGAVERRPGRLRLPALDRHGRARHRQDGDRPADLRRGRTRRRPRSRSSPRRAAPRGAWRSRPGWRPRPIHAALGWIPGQGPTVDELASRPADRRRDVDGEPRAAGDAAARRRAADARRARRRRRPARAGRRRQAVRGAGRGRHGTGRPAHAHLPAGGGEHDRARRARRAPRAAAVLRGGRRARRATSS